MKAKSQTIITILLVISIISSVYLSHLTSAASSQDIQNQIGFNPDAIPSSTQQAEDIANQYLKEQWGNIIQKIIIIGPIHNFFLNNPMIFQVLFNEPYSFSPSFVLMLFFWVYACILFSKIAKSTDFIKSGWPSFLVGLLLTIVIAHMNILKTLSAYIITLSIAQQTWWIRLFIWLLILIIVIAASWGTSQLNRMKAVRERNKEKHILTDTEKELDAVVKGLNEGNKVKEEVERTTKDEF